MRTLYMAHPFGDRIRLRAVEHNIERRTGLRLINPFYDVEGRMDVRKFDRMSKGRDFCDREVRKQWVSRWGLTPNHPAEVVERDLAAIRQCDGLIAFFPDKISLGTPMEFFYAAYGRNMPTFAIVEDVAKRGHPWIEYLAAATFKTADEFIDYVRSGVV
jgi:nucleoside 2-deoxyribosyltransferase